MIYLDLLLDQLLKNSRINLLGKSLELMMIGSKIHTNVHSLVSGDYANSTIFNGAVSNTDISSINLNNTIITSSNLIVSGVKNCSIDRCKVCNCSIDKSVIRSSNIDSITVTNSIIVDCNRVIDNKGVQITDAELCNKNNLVLTFIDGIYHYQLDDEYGVLTSNRLNCLRKSDKPMVKSSQNSNYLYHLVMRIQSIENV